MLLIAAGLFVRSLGKASAIDPGFSAKNVLFASLDVFPSGYDEERGKVFYRDLFQRLAALPGVEAVSATTVLPLDLAAAGLAVGLAAAVGVSRLMASQLFGLSPADPLVFATVAAVLAAVSIFASWLPARTAAAVDPVVALRAE